jgi:hypothetical protein
VEIFLNFFYEKNKESYLLSRRKELILFCFLFFFSPGISVHIAKMER